MHMYTYTHKSNVTRTIDNMCNRTQHATHAHTLTYTHTHIHTPTDMLARYTGSHTHTHILNHMLA